MARSVEAVLKANVSQHNAAIDSAATKYDQLGQKAVAAGAKMDAGLAKGTASAVRARDQLGRFTGSAGQGLDKASLSAEKYGKYASSISKNSAGLDKTARGLRNIGVAGVAGFGYAVKSAADFDEAVSHVGATGADASNNIDSLKKAALDYGAATQFSATQAANAEEELAKAGVSAADTLKGGLAGALNLAAAGGLSVARSAEIAGTALKQFELDGADIPKVADLLAAGANAAVGSVDDLAEGLKYVGPVAHGMGISITQTVGALTQFAAAGLVGEQGGTALRGVLLSLTSPSQVAAKEIAKLGINLYDSQGKFVGVDGAAQQLQDSMRGLSEAERNQALGRIFGNTQITAANILMRGGAADVNKYTAAVDQQGAAAEQARKRMDNLKGDVEKLGGSLQTAFISSGEGVQSPFRNIVEGLTGVVDGFNNASDAKKAFALDIVGIGSAGALAAAGVIKIAQAAVSAKNALAALKISAATAGIATAGIAAGLVVGAIAFQHYAEKAAQTRQDVSELTDALVASNGAIDENIQQTRAKSLIDSGAADAANKLGISTADLTQASLGNADAQGRVSAALTQAGKEYTYVQTGAYGAGQNVYKFGREIKTVEDAVKSGNSKLADSRKKYQQMSEATSAAIGPISGLSDAQEAAYKNANALGAAIDALRGPLVLTADQSKQLSQQLFAEGQGAIAASNAHISYEQSISSANAAIKKNGDTLSESTKKGQANKQALNQLAAAGQGYVQSLVAQGAGAKHAASATADVRSNFIKTAEAAGMSGRAAGKLADSYGLVPKRVSTTFDTFGLALQQTQVANYQTALKALPAAVQLKIQSAFDRGGADEAKRVFDQYDKTVPKPVQLRADGAPAKKAADSVQKALFAVSKTNPKPKIFAPNLQAKAAADATTKALQKTGAQKPKPKIGDPGSGAKNRADDTTKALQKTGAQRPKPKIGDPGTTAKKRADDATSALQRIPKSVTPRINVSSNASGVAHAANVAISNVRGKTVTITVKRKSGPTLTSADGGYIPAFDDGGRVRGIGGPREDNITGIDRKSGIQTSLVSVGEFVEPVKAVDYYGLGVMEGIRTRKIPRSVFDGLADGGQVQARRLAAGGSAAAAPQAQWYGANAYRTPLVNITAIDRMIVALSDPLRAVAVSGRAVAAAQTLLAAETRKVAGPKANLDRAKARELAAGTAKDELTLANARQTAAARKRVADAQADLKSGKATKAERRALDRAQAAASKVSRDNTRENAEASARLTKATKDRTAAQAAYNVVAEKSKAATDRLKEAQAALAAQQQAVADQARQIASTLMSSADSTSTDPMDVLAKRKETAASLTLFNQQLLALRKAGLNDQDITDLVGRGALDGSELAQNILAGGKKMVAALNLAQQQLTKAADKVGITSAVGVLRRADGGEIHGPGGPRGDKVHVLGSDGEFMVNAPGYAANAGLIRAANDANGRDIMPQIIRGFQALGGHRVVSPTYSDSHDVTMPIHVEQMGATEQQVLAKMQHKLATTLVAHGLTGASV